MCYYNNIRVSYREYIKLVALEAKVKEWARVDRPLVSGFMYEDYPIVKPVDGGREIELEAAHWELIPSMVQSREGLAEFRKRYNTLNAKGEGILTSPFYKDAAVHRRCLVLSSGFYEWRKYKVPGAKKEESYPYHITVKDRDYFFMAGIWQPWTDRETGESIDTFSLVTTAANPTMELIHNSKKRMPTILPENLALEWLQDGLAKERIHELATYQLPDDMMEFYTVRKDFRQVDDPMEAFEYRELPALGEDGLKAPGLLF